LSKPAAQRSRRKRNQGITLIEMIIVVVIIAIASAGITMSLGALSRANLKAGAGKLAGAIRYAFNRAVVNGTTVRVHFQIPGDSFSIEEAHGGILLATRKEKEMKLALRQNGAVADAIDPWLAAEARIRNPDKPSLGTSPFGPLTNADGDSLKRYSNIPLGQGVQFVKLISANEAQPRTRGDGALHFFPGGRTEHAYVELSDGRGGAYTVELNALTGRVRIYAQPYEKIETFDKHFNSEDESEASEVKE
jgi:prepilin-type N-terminal cleavage/methylation domain-containing protein